MNHLLAATVLAIASVVPSPPLQAPATGQALPSTPPVPSASLPMALPQTVERTLPNGLRVIYVRRPELPVVQATLVVSGAGEASDEAETAGRACFTVDMLDEGAGGRSAIAIAELVEQLGARLAVNCDADAARVQAYALRRQMPAVLRLLADVATRPEFPTGEFARVRALRLNAVRRALDDPALLANVAFPTLVYSSKHPYGRPATVRSLEHVDRDALVRHHEKNFVPSAAFLLLVGDADADTLHEEVVGAFGDRKGVTLPGDVPDAPPALDTPVVYVIDRPGAVQTQIRIGHPGPPRRTPDYVALRVLNTVLGGSFTSRLNANLREKHGYSYGAGSSFVMRRGPGPFWVGTAVRTDATAAAVGEILGELRRLQNQPVPDEELERAKRFVALGYPRELETNRALADELAGLQLHGLPLDFLERYPRDVMAVTAAQIQEAARRHLRTDALTIVLVGDRAQIEAPVRALSGVRVDVQDATRFVQ